MHPRLETKWRPMSRCAPWNVGSKIAVFGPVFAKRDIALPPGIGDSSGDEVVTEAQATVLGDIGGTNARFALLAGDALSPVASLRVGDFASVGEALRHFLRTHRAQGRVSAAILAGAGPVEANRCALTNSPWTIDGAELRAAFGLDAVVVLNDFEAVAWATTGLGPQDIRSIGGGVSVAGAVAAVLGPGTGLGVASLVRAPGGSVVLGSEGGHVTLPGTSAREDAVIGHLRRRFGHVSAEKALSGGGLENLYAAVGDIDGVAAVERRAAEITQGAVSGACQVSAAALDMFCALLGTVAGNVALTLGARGGVYIAGGIVPRIVDYLARSEFRARFEAKGRFQPYLARIPTAVIMHPDPAFIGLKAMARERFAAG
jgi:glucokinase